MTLNQGYLNKFKVSERKVNYLSPIYTFLIEKHLTFPLQTKIVSELGVCHDFNLSNIRKFKVIE